MDAQQNPTDPRTEPHAALHCRTATESAAPPAAGSACERELDELLAQAAHRARLLGRAQLEAIARHHHTPDVPRNGLHTY